MTARLLISGVSGKMGAFVREIAEAEGTEIVCGVDRAGGAFPFPVYPDFDSVKEKADVVIDFSRPDALDGLLAYAERTGAGAVIATTGFDEAAEKKIRAASQRVAIFRTANFSIGVNLLVELTKRAAAFLGEDFDVEIVEKHHRRKVDAPSGTALMLAEAVESASAEETTRVYGRARQVGARRTGEIGIHAVRGGTIVGEHEVIFAGTDEVVTLAHSAGSRAVFAKGALRAAAFLVGKPAGLYDMRDVLGLK